MEALTSKKSLEEACDSILQMYSDKNLFWGNILIASGDNIEFQKSYGFANYEWSIPNSHDTVFRIGCITKFITAIRILQLCEAGKLNLLNTVADFFPATQSTPIGPITIHQLLSHSSGLKDFFEVDDFPNKVIGKDEFSGMLQHATLGFEPGSQSEYANVTYTLLSYIIEDITGNAFHVDIKNNIFDPIGMSKSTIEHGHNDLVKEKAFGYMNTTGAILMARFFNVNVYKGCAACYSTTPDMHRLCQAFMENKLLSIAMKEKMLLIRRGHDPYGCNIRFKALDNGLTTQVIFKNGGVYGYRTTIVLVPGDQRHMVILANLEIERETFIHMTDEILTVMLTAPR